ncbi:MAG TPA: AAA family ATPase [Longimicrobium sp.]|jgi:hypothetical protein
MEHAHLRSFEVEGYRAIRHLRLPQLERVNLFVGLNNTGKTSLLEAVQLYGTQSPVSVLLRTLRDRAGFRPRFSTVQGADVNAEQVYAAVEGARSLFHGNFTGSMCHPIRLGPTTREGNPLTIELPWATPEFLEESADLEIYLEFDSPLLRVAKGSAGNTLTVGRMLRGFSVPVPGTRRSTALVPVQGLDAASVNRMWDEAAASGHASDVEEALRTILPELERIYLIGESTNAGRSVAMQLAGTRRAVPLSSMGDGTNRVFALALACVQARDGVLLVDEIENGLHHTVQEAVWKMVFAFARQLDLQVFATTHSWDAVVGFQAAANQSSDEGLLYRLERETSGEIYAERYTEEEVAVAADQQVEVR